MNIRLSLVSHGQATLANQFLADLAGNASLAEIVATANCADDEPLRPPADVPCRVLTNPSPLGFAANHNQAFEGCTAPYFCVANPDIRLQGDPFPALLRCMDDPRVGVVAPLVLSPHGTVEDNARRFPTPLGLWRKARGIDDGRYPLIPGQGKACSVEWAAGMFLLFRSAAFRSVKGFDDRFHLYYEDVDICARLWQSGWKVVCDPRVVVIHDARRASHHEPRYMVWHTASMARYFGRYLGRLPGTVAYDGP
jgi:N-acetylglucosaminyl-diphospho-decaprenol L-rhamnosyltransferase